MEGYQNTSIRGSLLIEPNDNFSAYLKAEIVEDDDLPVARIGRVKDGVTPFLTSPPYAEAWIEPDDKWSTKISPPPPGGFFTKRDMTFLTAELVWSLSNDITVTSLTGLPGRRARYRAGRVRWARSDSGPDRPQRG